MSLSRVYRYLHHPMFFLEFRDTAFVARDLGSGEIAGYLLGFVAQAGDGYILPGTSS